MLTIGTTCSEAGLRPLIKDTSLPPASTFDNASYEDTIEAVSEPLSSMDSISPLVSLLALCYRCTIENDASSPIITSVHHAPPPDRLSTLMNTMAQSPACKTHRHEEMNNSFIRLLSTVLSGMAGQYEFAEAVGAFSAPDDFRDFWTFQGRNLIRDVVQGGGTGYARGSELPFVNVFVRDPTCRIALTREGKKLLLVPGETQAGDAIFGAAGGDESRHWTVRLKGSMKVNIGEAFTD